MNMSANAAEWTHLEGPLPKAERDRSPVAASEAHRAPSKFAGTAV